MGKVILKAPMSIKGMKQLIKDLQTIQKKLPTAYRWFIKYSMEFVKERANLHLQDAYHDSMWYIRSGELESSWVTTIDDDKLRGLLENIAPYSAFVEYGTGANGSHPMSEVVGYEYNEDLYYGWYFYPEGYDERHHTFGNEGYEYLHNAILDYVNSEVPNQLFDKAFMKVMGKKLNGE